MYIRNKVTGQVFEVMSGTKIATSAYEVVEKEKAKKPVEDAAPKKSDATPKKKGAKTRKNSAKKPVEDAAPVPSSDDTGSK